MSQIEKRRIEIIRVPLTPKEKVAWGKAAERCEIPLAEWVRKMVALAEETLGKATR